MTSGPVAILKTTDLDSTVDWYEKAGFRLHGRQPNWCEVGRDGVVLQFLAGETPWPEPPTFTGTIYLYPESVDEVLAGLPGEVKPDWGPEDREWGTREVGFRDPNGYYLTFSEPLPRT